MEHLKDSKQNGKSDQVDNLKIKSLCPLFIDLAPLCSTLFFDEVNKNREEQT